MFNQTKMFIKNFPAIYSNFAKTSPNLNAFLIAVSSTVTASAIVAKTFDDRANSTIKDLQDDNAFLRAKLDETTEKFNKLENFSKSNNHDLAQCGHSLNECEKSLLQKTIELKVCKSDFKNASIFHKHETLPEKGNDHVELTI